MATDVKVAPERTSIGSDVPAARAPETFPADAPSAPQIPGGLTMSARTLRGLGEKADCRRATPLALVQRNGPAGPTHDIMDHDEAMRQQQRGDLLILARVETEPELDPRNWMQVVLKLKSGREIDTSKIDLIDAAFWSESALEKFVWPYYEGMRIWDIDYLPRLKEAVKDKRVCGTLHVGESIQDLVTDGPARLVVDTGRETAEALMTLAEFEAFQARTSAQAQSASGAPAADSTAGTSRRADREG